MWTRLWWLLDARLCARHRHSGWHLHVISDDRARGGHVLDCAGEGITLDLEPLDDFRLAMPETADFLAADLTGDTERALDMAERGNGR